METTDTETWHSFPAPVVPSPVLALAAGPGGIWARGAGGVAWYTQGDAWAPRVSGLALRGVAALARAGSWLLAGGGGGNAPPAGGGPPPAPTPPAARAGPRPPPPAP